MPWGAAARQVPTARRRACHGGDTICCRCRDATGPIRCALRQRWPAAIVPAGLARVWHARRHRRSDSGRRRLCRSVRSRARARVKRARVRICSHVRRGRAFLNSRAHVPSMPQRPPGLPETGYASCASHRLTRATRATRARPALAPALPPPLQPVQKRFPDQRVLTFDGAAATQIGHAAGSVGQGVLAHVRGRRLRVPVGIGTSHAEHGARRYGCSVLATDAQASPRRCNEAVGVPVGAAVGERRRRLAGPRPPPGNPERRSRGRRSGGRSRRRTCARGPSARAGL